MNVVNVFSAGWLGDKIERVRKWWLPGYDEKDKLLPVSCGASFFEQAVNEFRRLVDDRVPPTQSAPDPGEATTPGTPSHPGEPTPAYKEKVADVVVALEKRYQAQELTWNDLYRLQSLLLPLYPPLELEGRRATLRDAFLQRAPQHLITSYQQANPPPLNRETEYQVALADAQRLHAELVNIDTYRPHQEHKRDVITFNLYLSLLVAVFCIVFGGLAAMLWQSFFGPDSARGVFPFICLVMMLGAIGSVISSQRRLQTSFDQDGSILNSTRYVGSGMGTKLGPFNGAVFAFALYCLLHSGLASSVLLDTANGTTGTASTARAASAPASQPSAKPTPTNQEAAELPAAKEVVAPYSESTRRLTGTSRWQWLLELFLFGPGNIGDYCKMLIYAFLAGFAERLVPDTLDRLTRADDDKKG